MTCGDDGTTVSQQRGTNPVETNRNECEPFALVASLDSVGFVPREDGCLRALSK